MPQLRKAWRSVLANATKPNAAEKTTAEALTFSLSAEPRIDRISRELRKQVFKFSPQRGAPIKKSPGKYRGVVVAPIPNRIVQRSILDVLQGHPAIRARLNAGLNFGEVPRNNDEEDVGVPGAAKLANQYAKIHSHFIRTDIIQFFDNVPRDKAVNILVKYSDSNELSALLHDATVTELSNLALLDHHKSLFPLEDIGLAQGSCLSPLVCNLYLDEFDKLMNDRGVNCVRYIDDFVIFASSERKLHAALASASNYLSESGLKIYDPKASPEKAKKGLTSKGFDFLGCNIRPDRVIPSGKNRGRLLDKLRGITDESLRSYPDSLDALRSRRTLTHTLWKIGETIRGWGNTYSFCTDDGIRHGLDQRIDGLLQSYLNEYRTILRGCSVVDRHRLLGVWRLNDCRRDEEFIALVTGKELHSKRSPKCA